MKNITSNEQPLRVDFEFVYYPEFPIAFYDEKLDKVSTERKELSTKKNVYPSSQIKKYLKEGKQYRIVGELIHKSKHCFVFANRVTKLDNNKVIFERDNQWKKD